MTTTGHHPARLLAIDDSVLIHRLLKAHLRDEAVELHSATSGADGLQMARALNPDAILLDVDIGDMTGFEVLSALKADPITHQTPVLFVSGSCDTNDRVRGLDLGAVDFILKPFEIAELKARVRSAVRMTRLIRMLAARAHLDGMTGLWNRAYFDERLHQEFAEAVRHRTDLSLILADIDHFKSINDRFGHPFGDTILEDVGRALSENRVTDIVCRYGGEEFALILPRESASGAAIVAERCRQAIENRRWPLHREVVVTASFGVADLQSMHPATPASLVQAADEALYDAKQGGRNSVRVHEGGRQKRRKIA